MNDIDMKLEEFIKTDEYLSADIVTFLDKDQNEIELEEELEKGNICLSDVYVLKYHMTESGHMEILTNIDKFRTCFSFEGIITHDYGNWTFETEKCSFSDNVCTAIDELLDVSTKPGDRFRITIEKVRGEE